MSIFLSKIVILSSCCFSNFEELFYFWARILLKALVQYKYKELELRTSPIKLQTVLYNVGGSLTLAVAERSRI